MAELLLTLHCARLDVEAVVEAVRAVSRVPVHVRDEAVHGRDFGDASTAERVTGELRRAAVELVVAGEDVAAVVEAARTARRRLPVRWHTVAVVASGRIE